jgi:molybdate transport system permease protein
MQNKEPIGKRHKKSDWPFFGVLIVISSFYIVLLLALLISDALFITPSDFWETLKSPEIQYSIKLSLFSCTITTILSLIVAVPISYLMSHFQFKGKSLLDGILDIPIVLPPLVIGISLLILFNQTPFLKTFDREIFPITYEIPSIILAQFMVACAFAVRTLRGCFEQINPRQEQVALTLGCSQSQAFWKVVLPQANHGLISAATIAWARSLGEFGPILIFSGLTRMKTEVLSSSVYLELSVGNLKGAISISLLMIFTAMVVLIVMRNYGTMQSTRKGANR